MGPDTIIRLASCTKLMVEIAVLQCVERGQLVLDSEINDVAPEVGKMDNITGFDEDSNQPIVAPGPSYISLWSVSLKG